MVSTIINQLISDKRPYKELTCFSDRPGIYALFFHGTMFPLSYQPHPEEIIYIGKTEVSQKARDKDTHFAIGKTGSSTLRKSFGAMLMDKLILKPVPRSLKDIEANRTFHFKFDNPSELILTDWMQSNLGLAFYPYPKSKSEIDNLETLLIQQLNPILNIDWKNPNNPHSLTIKALRKLTATIAYNSDLSIHVSKTIKNPETNNKSYERIGASLSRPTHKYEDIWKQLFTSIIKCIIAGNDHRIYIGEKPFQNVGNRKSYSFTLKFKNATLENNVSGSAVARDLLGVLYLNENFQKAAKRKFVKIRLDKTYELHIQTKCI